MKKNLLIFLILPILLFSQQQNYNLDQHVVGMMKSSRGTYLILKKGFIKIYETDPHTEYYRRIYNDSTLTSPNTELKENFNFDIIPFLSPGNEKQRKIDFLTPLQLGLFININENNGIYLSSFAEHYIDSLNQQRVTK